MNMLTVIAYKPNSSCSYRNCEVDRYESDCVVATGDNLPVMAAYLANILERDLCDQESGYDLTFIVDGEIIVNTEGDTSCNDFIQVDLDDYDYETDQRKAEFVAQFRRLLSSKIQDIKTRKIEQIKRAEELKKQRADEQAKQAQEIKNNLEIQQLKELAEKYPDVVKDLK